MQKNIVFEDSHIIVVYKPAGIATQTARLGQQDMVSELKNYLAAKAERAVPSAPYLGVIHRLDQPVSGILVFAKTKQAASCLGRQIADGVFRKYYYAVVHGRPEREKGRLEDYLYKDGRTNLSRIVDQGFPDAKRAVLEYSLIETLMVLEPWQETSLVKISLLTGRHHQIRLQMANAGMPLLGDHKYGSEQDRQLSREIGLKNVALCAYRLQFRHPAAGGEVCFEQTPEEEIFRPFFNREI
ncbi:MAG: RluA family pseudouridine synthase [Lachnospiraceae bacterium]|nr:RluA family pseudouridine synthase [Lachnospiraceae bacterium]